MWQTFLEQNNSLLAVQDLPGQIPTKENYYHALGLPESMTQLELDRVTRDFSSIHPSWLTEAAKLSASYESIQSQLGDTLNDLIRKTDLIDKNIVGIDFHSTGSVAGLPTTIIGAIEKDFTNIIGSYDCFAGSFHELSDIIKLPAFVLPGAAREVLTTAQVIRSCGVVKDGILDSNVDDEFVAQDVRDIKSDCVGMLRSVDHDLALPYIGAWESLNGNNSDRARHILASLRELWSHLLRKLAPDAQVLSWVTGKDSNLIDKGKPTRRARVLYICRDIDNDPLKEFVGFDVMSFVNMLGFLNSMHKLKHGLTESQLRRLMIRTDSYLMFLLQIGVE